MESVKNIKITKTINSQYVQPFRIHYQQDGVDKIWDCIKSHDSVSILIYNVTRDVLVLVKQFRPAVHIGNAKTSEVNGETTVDVNKYPASLGVTHELCAGIVDKDKPVKEIAQQEVLEECGYQVPLENIIKIETHKSNVGISGSQQDMFYAKVTDEMRVSSGGGSADEGELIDVVEIPASDCLQFALDSSNTSPVGLKFAMFWFHYNILSKRK